MSSGGKQVVLNTRERIVSNDENRLQAFIGAELSEVLRRLVSNRSTVSPFTLGGGVDEFSGYVNTTAQDTAAIGTPLKGDVLEGLVVLPQAGTLNLLVSPGAVVLDDPDGQAGSSQATPASLDDSRGKLVLDPGIATAGVLVLAGGGGGTRVDVIECRRQQLVLETDSRDVFDPGTETFAPQVVNKVVAATLEYRVRQGTPGSGVPANQQGWLPLCIASVPSSATTVDDCTFWDVRPLVKDRVNAPFETQSINGAIDPTSTLIHFYNGAIDDQAAGYLMARLGMYKAGGFIGLDFFDSALWSPGYVPAANAVWYLYAVFPLGLPRWARYASAPSLRLPEGPRGVLTISDVAPNAILVGTSINTPLLAGLGSAAGPAAVLTAGYASASTPLGSLVSKEWHRPIFPKSVAPTSSTANDDSYVLTPGVHFPANARRLQIMFGATFTGTASTTYQVGQFVATVLIQDNLGNTLSGVPTGRLCRSFSTLGTDFPGIVLEVDVPANQQLIGLPDDNLRLTFAWSQSAGTKSLPGLSIFAFQF